MSSNTPPAKAPKPQSALRMATNWSTSEAHVIQLKDFTSKISEFYNDHCPEKKSGISNVVNRIYQNDEVSLVRDLCSKYDVSDHSEEYVLLLTSAFAVQEAYSIFKGEGGTLHKKPEKESASKHNTDTNPATLSIPSSPNVILKASNSQEVCNSPDRPFSGNFRDTVDQQDASAYFTNTNTEHSKAIHGAPQLPTTSAPPLHSPQPPPPPPPPPRSSAAGVGHPPPRLPPHPPSVAKDVPSVTNGNDIDEEGIDGDGDEYRSSIHQYEEFGDSPIIREGNLTKLRSKDGVEEMHYFILRENSLVYVKKQAGNVGTRAKNNAQLLLSSMTGYSFGTDNLEEELTRSINLEEVLVLPLSKGDRGGGGAGSSVGVDKLRASITSTNIMADVEDDDRTFRLFSREKSFFLRAQSKLDRNAWFDAIKIAATSVQMNTLKRPVSQAEVCPIRVIADSVSECQVCHNNFGVMTRRHHCRACGACVCEQCSREKVRIPSLDAKALFKVCNLCAHELKAARRYGSNRSNDL